MLLHLTIFYIPSYAIRGENRSVLNKLVLLLLFINLDFWHISNKEFNLFRKFGNVCVILQSNSFSSALKALT